VSDAPWLAVRRLAPGEAAAYREIRLAGLLESPEAFGSVYDEAAGLPLETFERRLSASSVIAAFADGTIVGMASVTAEEGLQDRHKAFVTGFFVRAAYRGNGVADALLAAVVRAAVAPVEQLLLTVVAGNDRAVRFFERHGFQRYGLEPRALKTPSGYRDEILFVRSLPSV